MSVAKVIVLDIEGTVCPISFVHDTLFPYALEKARQEIGQLKFPLDPKSSELEAHLMEFPEEYRQLPNELLKHIEDLVDRDVKIGYLKSLQGFLWRTGYENGQIKAPIYDDAVKAIKRWSKTSKIYIYSSGSVPAQKLLFKYTESGDLNGYLSGYFDTQNAGPKIEPQSYENITKAIQADAADIRFYSDNPKEIDAATRAGWKTTFTVRPGNPDYSDYKWPDKQATTFDE